MREDHSNGMEKAQMSKRKEQQITAALMNTALHHLGELNVPFVLKLEGCDTIFSNVAPRHAVAIVEDCASLTSTLREKGIEAKVERLIDTGEWGGPSSA